MGTKTPMMRGAARLRVVQGFSWLYPIALILVFAALASLSPSAILCEGLVAAGLLIALVPPPMLSTYGSGPLAMLLMALVGIPLYICAAAATPIAAGMLLAGVFPGTALVFLLARPIASAATLGLLRREFANAGLAWYLGGIIVSTIAIGMATDAVISVTGLDVAAQAGAAQELLPAGLEAVALTVLLWLGSRPLRQWLRRRLSTVRAS